MTDRREFLKQASAAAAMAAVAGSVRPARALTMPLGAQADSANRELLMVGLNAADMAGADYTDVRIGRQQQNFVFTRETQIQNVVDQDTLGCGIRVLVDGTWGFAATRILTQEGVSAAAREAVALAKAHRIARDRPVELLPVPTFPDARWTSAHQIDPWDVSIEEKAEYLLSANEAAMRAPAARFVFSGLFFVKDERNFASSEGSVISQTFVRSWPTLNVTAVSADFSDFQSRNSVIAPMGLGWEYILEQDFPAKAQQWGEEASEKLTAKPVDVGRYDLILDPTHLWLTIHESIGHPTELDRAMGYEANYAGTSFLAPPEDVLGKLKYGPEFMNIQGDRTQEGALSTIGYDDEGVQPDSFMIVKD